MKQTIVEEYQIVTFDLHEYPDLERRFNEYELASLSRPPGSYYPNLVQKYFYNYLALLEKDCPKGTKTADMRNRPQVPMRGVIIDIFDPTINMILFGQNI